VLPDPDRWTLTRVSPSEAPLTRPLTESALPCLTFVAVARFATATCGEIAAVPAAPSSAAATTRAARLEKDLRVQIGDSIR